MPRESNNDNCRVYVGNLPRDAEEREISRAFERFGVLRSVWVARNPPGFAFVVFEAEASANEAIRSLDGTQLCGVRIHVEASGGARGARSNPDNRCFECGCSGHYARDCPQRGPPAAHRRGDGPSDGGDRRRRRRRSQSMSRSRSPPPRRNPRELRTR